MILNTLGLPECIFYQQNARSYDPTPQQSPDNNDQRPGSARNREEQVIIAICLFFTQWFDILYKQYALYKYDFSGLFRKAKADKTTELPRETQCDG